MNLAEKFPDAAVGLQVHVTDWRGAIRAAGDLLVAAGVATDRYTDEMIAAVEEHGPYIVIAPGFALAHSRPSPAVLRTGLSWLSLAEPIEFGSAQNDPVRLVIGLAALDHDGHIQELAAIADLLQDQQSLQELLEATSPPGLRNLLAKRKDTP